MNSRIVPLVALAALAAGCAPQPAAPPDAAAIRTALEAQIAEFGPAFAAKDAAAVAGLFTEDGIWVLPDASTFSGRASIDSGATAFFGTVDSIGLGTMTIDKLIAVSDSEAVTFAHAGFTVVEKGKAPAQHVNAFADDWKKGTDGVWRIAYEINAEGPAPTAATP